MNIEQKLAYIRKALEMGANVEINFHDFRNVEEAEKAAVELSQFGGKSYVLKKSANPESNLQWFKFYDGVETTIFFDEKEEEATV